MQQAESQRDKDDCGPGAIQAAPSGRTARLVTQHASNPDHAGQVSLPSGYPVVPDNQSRSGANSVMLLVTMRRFRFESWSTLHMSMLDSEKSAISKLARMLAGFVDIVIGMTPFWRIQRNAIWPADLP